MQPARERVTEATMGGQGEENTTREGAEWCRWREKMGSMEPSCFVSMGRVRSLCMCMCVSLRECARLEKRTRERGAFCCDEKEQQRGEDTLTASGRRAGGQVCYCSRESLSSLDVCARDARGCKSSRVRAAREMMNERPERECQEDRVRTRACGRPRGFIRMGV